ncbi:DNA repair protein RadA [Candidatus Mikella endobia]|uniref:DNA repair protein RadA n=1 Tax=Candidatus Mikella endobia TaxID=1778264 RepID=A0A143WPK6_9ENTR|nr:DNA repair protein RadA [Candidatus Mikella endobia]CUX95668.1 DNA repair protein RadA [Candidatus Mikella endobia]
MAKIAKHTFACNQCDTTYLRWQGQCTVCYAWNSITEILFNSTNSAVSQDQFSGYAGNNRVNKIQKLSEINIEDIPRFSTGFKELDRVLGGGIVPGSVILIGGNPGVGKSTLLMQTLYNITANMNTLYVTGEESLKQVALRAHRINLPIRDISILSETSIEKICIKALQKKIKLIIIDSIQVMHMTNLQSLPGSVTQIRESAAYLTRFAKTKDVAIIIVYHVTQNGSLAGPKMLEHCIDCSIMLNRDSDSSILTLRSHKNRFGAINELGLFTMTAHGLCEISNPSAIFLTSGEITSGSSVMVVWKGTRPLLVAIQALIDNSIIIENPRIVTVGLEKKNRLAILLAVLHRHGGLQIADKNLFINVVGGIKIHETSADLALMLAIISSMRDCPLPKDLVTFGEIGIAGEIRPVPSGPERIQEAFQHGFQRAIVPQENVPKKNTTDMQIFGVKKITDVLSILEKI